MNDELLGQTSPLRKGKWTTRWTDTYRLRPTGTRCGSLNGEHLTRSRRIRPPTGGRILGSHQKQGPPVSATQHAGEAAAVEIDGLQNLAALAHAHAMFGGNVRVPDSIFSIEADAVGGVATEFCPGSPVGQIAGSIDVEGRQFVSVRFGDDQRLV